MHIAHNLKHTPTSIAIIPVETPGSNFLRVKHPCGSSKHNLETSDAILIPSAGES